jgi:hypothetical protein
VEIFGLSQVKQAIKAANAGVFALCVGGIKHALVSLIFGLLKKSVLRRCSKPLAEKKNAPDASTRFRCHSYL